MLKIFYGNYLFCFFVFWSFNVGLGFEVDWWDFIIDFFFTLTIEIQKSCINYIICDFCFQKICIFFYCFSFLNFNQTHPFFNIIKISIMRINYINNHFWFIGVKNSANWIFIDFFYLKAQEQFKYLNKIFSTVIIINIINIH